MILIISCLLVLGYVLLMYAYTRGWRSQGEFVTAGDDSVFISVIIPARNEQDNIGRCIESILAQEYTADKFEVIVVDDHSEDETAAVAGKYSDKNVRCISLAEYLGDGPKVNAYKKAALSAGIAAARGALIVTTDADCTVLPEWLSSIAAIYMAEDPVMIVAPVIYSADNSVVQLFQLIDFMSMQGITAATHVLRLGNMSNGANLAFSKEAYMEVDGYEGTTHLATGDDYLLMVKMAHAFPGRISYLKSSKAIVTTVPQSDWSSFFRQRIRWASKSGKYKDTRLTAVLAFVYLFNFSLLCVAIVACFEPILFQWLAGMLVIKIIAELIFLTPVARFFDRQYALKYLPWLQPLHIGYIIIAGFLGFMGGYKWKGRSVR